MNYHCQAPLLTVQLQLWLGPIYDDDMSLPDEPPHDLRLAGIVGLASNRSEPGGPHSRIWTAEYRVINDIVFHVFHRSKLQSTSRNLGALRTGWAVRDSAEK